MFCEVVRPGKSKMRVFLLSPVGNAFLKWIRLVCESGRKHGRSTDWHPQQQVVRWALPNAVIEANESRCLNVKLSDWLISRRHCQKDWIKHIPAVREKIKHAILDMPENERIVDLLKAGSKIERPCFPVKSSFRHQFLPLPGDRWNIAGNRERHEEHLWLLLLTANEGLAGLFVQPQSLLAISGNRRSLQER